MPPLLKMTVTIGSRYRQIVSISMPLKPKALSPSIATTGLSLVTAAAIAKPMPTPITPQVPQSRRVRGASEVGLHALHVLLFVLSEIVKPFRAWPDLAGLESRQ